MDCSIRAVIFDIDDTLYDEMTFVQSGFRAVARYLNMQYNLDKEEAYQEMLSCLEKDGRGQIFDSVLKSHGIHTSQLIEELVETYRVHTPEISLYPDVVETFKRLHAMELGTGIITDGLHTVQKRKVGALKLQDYVDFIIYTDELGPNYEKPHPASFLQAIRLLNLKPKNVLYVGNNPEKDISGANSVGMQSFHLCRGVYTCDGACNAGYHAKSLRALFNIITLKPGGEGFARI